MRALALAAAAVAAATGAVLEILAVRAGTGWSAGEALLDLLAGWGLLAAAVASRGLTRGARRWCAAAATLWLVATVGLLPGQVGQVGSHLATLWLGPLAAAVLSAPRGWPDWPPARWVIVAAVVRGAAPGLAAMPLVTVALGLAIVVAGARDLLGGTAQRPASARSDPAAARWAAVALGAACAVGGLAQAGGGNLDATDDVLGLAVLFCGAALLAVPSPAPDATSVSQLVVDLGRLRDTRAQQQLLADALGDPDVRLLVRLAPELPWVDLTGRPAGGEARAGRALTPLRTASDPAEWPAAALEHEPGALDDPALRRTVMTAGALLVARLATTAQAARQTQALASSRRRFVAAEADERALIARQVDDGPGRRLDEAGELLDRAIGRVPLANTLLRADLERARDHVDGGRQDLMATVSGDLSLELVRHGLTRALRDLAAAAGATSEIDPGLDAADLPVDVSRAAWFVASEACTNALRHAGPARVRLRAWLSDAVVVVEVEDDGAGGADRSGRGLAGLAARVSALGGELHVVGGAEGGTRVTAHLPVDGDGSSGQPTSVQGWSVNKTHGTPST